MQRHPSDGSSDQEQVHDADPAVDWIGRDRGGASTPVGVEHVTVDRDHPLAELFEVEGCPERASDQALNLGASPRGLSSGDLATGP